MDGLLLDSERIVLEISREASEALGLAWRREVALAMIGRNTMDNNALLRREYGDSYPFEAHAAEFGRRYEALIRSGAIPLKPGVHELLDRLDALAIPRAVATSTAHERAVLKLQAVGLFERFNALIGGDEILRGKPEPDIFLAAAAHLKVDPLRCLALEDSNAGARAALAAGMSVRLIPDLLQPDAGVLAAGARVLDSLHEVIGELA